MKTKVYLDTSVISALFDNRAPERQYLTQTAWNKILSCEVFVSELVVEELQRASESLRAKLFLSIEKFTILNITDEAHLLAKQYIEQGIFPEKYYDDALHVAIASVNKIGILLSWNFTHLVKLKTRRMVSLINTLSDYSPVEIISPPEL